MKTKSLTPNYITSFKHVLATSARAHSIPITIFNVDDFKKSKLCGVKNFARQIEQCGFDGKDKQFCILRNESGLVEHILVGAILPVGIYVFAEIFEKIKSSFSCDFLSSVSFDVQNKLDKDSATNAAIGWMLASYKPALYKKSTKEKSLPVLKWPDKADKTRSQSMAEGLCLVKTLINTPANLLGTDELAMAAEQIAKNGKAKFARIVGKDLIEQNFPMIYEVGKASPRPPQIVDIKWGDAKHPQITLVGKGVVFDTGGLDLKPPAFMGLMKKDMGGAAHVLGLAHIIMSLNLRIHLRVLLAIAENSVAGNAFRPGDVIQSRKGLSVEIGDTDAEGRLVVSDALTYACEGKKKPDLMVDFCTLTGSARAVLGFDIPAFFSNRDTLLDDLKISGAKNEDPVWPLPLYQPYLKEMNSPIADINNIGSGKAGAIHGALFMHQFIDDSVDWIHLDCYAWEQSGKAGRPQGGADTGIRAVLKLIEDKFVK